MAQETLRDAIIRVSLEFKDTEVPDFRGVTQEVKAAEEATEGVFEDVNEGLEDVIKQAQKLEEEMEDIKKKSDESKQQVTDDTIRMNEGMITAAEGALALGRGIAFIGISSEEDLQKVFTALAKIQGAIDILKGSTDVMKGLVEGFRAVRTAAHAATAAQLGLSAANVAAASTMQLVTASIRAFIATSGPLIIIFTAFAVAWKQWGDQILDWLAGGEDSLSVLDRMNEQFGTLNSQLQEIQGVTESADIEILKKGNLVTAEERFARLDDIVDDFSKRWVDDFANRIETSGGTVLAFVDDLGELEESLERISENRGSVFETPGRKLLLNENEALETRRDATEDLLHLEEARGKFAQLRLNILKDEEKSLKTQVDEAHERLRLAEETAAQEKDALESFKERVGALTAEEFREALKASETFREEGAAGLTREQAALLGRVSPEVQRQFRTQQAEEFGFGELERNLGLDLQKRAREAQQRLEDLQRETLAGGFIAELEDMLNVNRLKQDEQLRILADIVTDIQDHRDRLRELEEALTQ